MTSPERHYRHLKAGDPAPRFSLPSWPEGRGSLGQYLGRHQVLLVFQGRYFLSGTSSVDAAIARVVITLSALSADADRFEAANTRILAVARETPQRQRWMSEYLQLRFPVLSDEAGDVGQAYGLLPENRWAGSSDGYDRSCVVMLLDRSGVMRWTAVANLIASPRASVPVAHAEEWDRIEPFRLGSPEVLQTEALLTATDLSPR